MGTENTGQSNGGRLANTGYGRALQATVGKYAEKEREQQALASIDRQRRQQTRRSTNIQQAESNRAARVAQTPQLANPAPRNPWG